MDPLDHALAGLDGIDCAVCEGPVPAGSIHLLARRDDLTIVQVECPTCSSTSLAFVVRGSHAPPPRPAISADDVLDMHVFLRAWRGDLRDLVTSQPGAEGS